MAALTDNGASRTALCILAAVLTNFSLGLLYCWTLLATPVASLLEVSSASVGTVPSLSLLTFTVGVNLYPSLAARYSSSAMTILVFALSATGLALFAVAPSMVTIHFGYGLIFGTASGIGYAMAIGFVSDVPARLANIALGLCVTSFAMTAIVLTVPIQHAISSFGTRAVFASFALMMAVVGAVVATAHRRDALGKSAGIALEKEALWTPLYVASAAAFFACCFIGLGTMANSQTLLQKFGVDTNSASASAAVFNSAYVIGSLFGGLFAGFLTGRRAIICLVAVLAIIIALAIISQTPTRGWLLTISAACGLGATASVFPVHLAQAFGRENAPTLFARLIVFYGLAGATAPWVVAFVNARTGSITPFLVIAFVFAAFSVPAVFAFGVRRR